MGGNEVELSSLYSAAQCTVQPVCTVQPILVENFCEGRWSFTASSCYAKHLTLKSAICRSKEVRSVEG